jgi:hypothetical protein
MATVSLPSRFYAGAPTASFAAIYTTPAGESDVLTSVTISNNTDVAQQASMTVAGVSFYNNLDLAPRALVVLDFKQVMNAGESIQLKTGNAGTCTVFISGVKITS